MAKELDNKKMWESLMKRCSLSDNEALNNLYYLIRRSLKDQGFELDGENIVPIVPEFKIEAGKLYMCIKDNVYFGEKQFTKGKYYQMVDDDNVVSDNGEKWKFSPKKFDEHFRPATEEEIEYYMETKFKAGDIVMYIASHPAYSGIYILGAPNDLHIGYDNAGSPYNLALRNCTLATEPERSQFEKELKLDGYVWDAEKKELSHTKLTKKSDKEELSEFELAIHRRLNLLRGEWLDDEYLEKETRGMAKELLSIARKQFVKEASEWLNNKQRGFILTEMDIKDFKKEFEKGE